jgi:hypothetical protein
MNKSPTRSQRKEDRIPKIHHNIFDQTLLPEEDFSGGKLLRKRRTSGGHESIVSEKQKSTRSILGSTPQPNNPDEIEVVSQRPRSRQQVRETPTPRTISSQFSNREFRVRDKKIDYTIPSLKSLLPTPPRKQRSPAPPQSLPRVRAPLQSPISTPKTISRPTPRTITNRSGERSLLLKILIPPTKLVAMVRKGVHQPRIRIVESQPSRKRRIQEDEEEEPVEPKKEPEKPFGGILTKEDADTTRQTPNDIDRARFERAREKSLVRPMLSVFIVDFCTIKYYRCTVCF